MSAADYKRRLDAIADALPTMAEIEAAERRRDRAVVERRIQDRTATRSDFELLYGSQDDLHVDFFLESAGKTRYRLSRGLPVDQGLRTTAELIVSTPPDEQVPDGLLHELEHAALTPGPTHESYVAWVHANQLLVLLGPDQGRGLRDRFYARLGRYDPQWRALAPWGGPFPEMAERVAEGTADQRDFFFWCMPHMALFHAGLLVEAVGHRRARESGSPRALDGPISIAAELLSYLPAETPPDHLWLTIQTEADRPPVPETIETWREFNRVRVVVGRWDAGKRVRGILEEHWEVFEAEHRYLAEARNGV